MAFGLRRLLREFLPKFIRELEGALGFPRGGVNLVLDFPIRGGGVGAEELVDGDGGRSDLLVAAEGALGLELEEEREAGLGEVRLVDDEFHVVVLPFGAGAGILVDGRLLLRLWVAGDGDLGVDVHLREELYVLYPIRRYLVDVQWPVLHCLEIFSIWV